jgi:hypothetical protein
MSSGKTMGEPCRDEAETRILGVECAKVTGSDALHPPWARFGLASNALLRKSRSQQARRGVDIGRRGLAFMVETWLDMAPWPEGLAMEWEF